MNTERFTHYCPTCRRALCAHEVERVEYLLVCSHCGSEVDEYVSSPRTLYAASEYALLIVVGAMLAFSLAAVCTEHTMTALDALLALAILLALVSGAYWCWQAHRAAQRNRTAFAPRSPTPAHHDHQELVRRRRDAEHDAAIELRWREAVARNLAQRAEHDEQLPALLRRQAG